MTTFKTKLTKSIRKHGRLFPYLGALIVFVTFVVKDGLREHLRDLTSEVTTASNVFEIRADNMETWAELGDLEKHLRNDHAASIWQPDIRLIQTNAQQMYYSLGAVSYLVETTHGEQDLVALTALDKELTSIRFSSLDLNLSPATVSTLGLRASAVGLKLAAFEDDVMKHARYTLQEREKWYDLWTWSSYILYTIGWSLGFVGRVYGVTGIGEA